MLIEHAQYQDALTCQPAIQAQFQGNASLEIRSNLLFGATVSGWGYSPGTGISRGLSGML